MLLQSISNNLRQQNWSILFLELLVVIIGLVLAFQVDRWWEDRDDRTREQEYIARLITEINEDIEQIQHAIMLAEVRQDFCELLLQVADNPAVAEQQPSMFLVAVAQAAFTYSPPQITHTYDDLRSTGNMGLIRSEKIKKALYNYHSFHDSQQQYIQLNLDIEMHYFELAANVLNAGQYKWVQDQWFVVTRERLEAVRQAEPDLAPLPGAIERFTSNTQLINWIPHTRGIQREQILMNGMRMDRADELLEALNDHNATLIK